MAAQDDVNNRPSGLLPLILRTFRKKKTTNAGNKQNLLRTGNDLWREIGDRRKFGPTRKSGLRQIYYGKFYYDYGLPGGTFHNPKLILP